MSRDVLKVPGGRRVLRVLVLTVRKVVVLTVLAVLLGSAPVAAQTAPGSAANPERPFGTLREQAEMQQRWLKQRLDTILPPLMRKHAIDMWVVPMREYNEDPIFSAITAPETFAARRRTIYVFFDKCAAGGSPTPACVERIALGGTSQGGVFEARRSTQAAAGNVGRGQQAELWGDEQWRVLKTVIEERKPRTIGINRSTVFAFADGLSSGELKGMSAALGETWTSRFKDAELLPVELIAARLPDEEVFFRRMQELVWSMTQTMFSNKVITPGKTRTSDLVWWWRQRVNDQGLGTWFQPSVSVQRKGKTEAEIGADPIIERGDVLHCDVGITVARLNTDTQHNAYVLLPGETDAPEGLRRALGERQRAAGHRDGRDQACPERQPDPAGLAGADESEGRQRHALFASDRPARARRGSVDRPVGLPERRPGSRRRARHSRHVVLDRAAGDHTRTRVGESAGPHGAGRRRHRRGGRESSVGAPASGPAVSRALIRVSHTRRDGSCTATR